MPITSATLLEQEQQIIRLATTRRKVKTRQIITHNVFWAVWVGVIPLPFLDFLFTTAVQLKMIDELSLEYDLQFSKNQGKALIFSLIGGIATPALVQSQWLKFIPGIGTLSGQIHAGIVAGAITYAIGKVFERHFESGGTFLDFDPLHAKDYFKQMYQRGERLALGSSLAKERLTWRNEGNC